MSQRHAGPVALTLLLLAGLAVAPSAAWAALSLTSTAAPTFSANLNAGDQTTTYTVPVTAKDTSLITSPGWNLTITSTQLTTGGHTLSTGASQITAVTSVCASTCTRNPTNSITYPVAVPAAGTPPT